MSVNKSLRFIVKKKQKESYITCSVINREYCIVIRSSYSDLLKCLLFSWCKYASIDKTRKTRHAPCVEYEHFPTYEEDSIAFQ